MAHINNLEQTEKSNLKFEEALRSYDVEDISTDLSDRILARAAAFPRKNEVPKIGAIDILMALFRIFLFRRDYLPVTFALFMFGLMIVTGYQQKHSDANVTDMQNYTHILLPEENIVAGYNDDFHKALSEDMKEYMYNDLEDSFEI